MKSYYHQHELAYQQIKAKGNLGWGNAKTIEELGSPEVKAYLKEKIQKHFQSASNKFALDLGCGSGTTAFILAEHGFKTFGIDISETAIAMANDLALKQNLKINFVVGDVLNLAFLNQKFDLIYDSHLLHCIVLEEDRSKLYNEINDVLKPEGLFILDTMVMPGPEVDIQSLFIDLRFDENYILWHKTKSLDVKGTEEFNGQFWCAQRRIYPAKTVINEVLNAGFEILENQFDQQMNKPSMLRLVLRKLNP